MRPTLVFLASVISVVALAGKTEIAEEGNRVTKPGVISLSTSWIKDKGKKFDIGFKMRNESKENIIVVPVEIQCGRGGVSGRLKDEKAIALRSGEMKETTLTGLLSEKVKGPYKMTLTKVYLNPGADGKTLGKVLAEDVAWSVDIAD